jgi:hypothetical protein
VSDSSTTGDDERDHEAGDAAEPRDEDAADDGPVDQLGIPMSREPTLDDVRGDSGPHRSLAVGCSIAVIGVIAVFWLLRMLVLR